MSLEQAAKHLAAHGRGKDTALVHMTPREVSGLQAIARAHGGSLTINPETGLAEAGFLDKLMPMIVGAGLAYATGGMSLGAGLGMAGVSNAAIIGGGLGALETMRTGDLGKGIMTGLGAYGGAGLGGAAEGAGMFKDAATVPAAPAPDLMGPTTLHPNMVGPDTSPIVSDVIGADTEQLASSLPKGNLLANPLPPQPPSIGNLIMQNKGYAAAAAGPAIMGAMTPNRDMPEKETGMIRPYRFDYNKQTPTNMIGTTRQDGQDTSERLYFKPTWEALPPYKAAAGGLMSLAGGGPVEQMSNANALGANTGYPMADINKAAYATPYQTPVSQNVVQGTADTGVNPMTGEQMFAAGGLSTLGGYSDGGRLLKGPGDGMSDNIPAQIGSKQPARLADGEFVVPADVVSHLGNGSTDAGAKQLYKMMDRIRSQRTGKKKQAPEVNPSKAMPA